MADPDDDDPPAADWFSVKTEADAPALPVPGRDPVTAPHAISGDVAAAFEAGRRQGYAEGFLAGQVDYEAALMETFREHFGEDPVIRHTLARVREKITPV